MVALGLLILAGAGALALGGVLANLGSAHALSGSFVIFGYEVGGSTGQLFLYGMAVGAVAMLGLGLVMVGLGRGAKHRMAARRELKRSRRERNVLQQQHDRLADALEEQHGQAGAQPAPVRDGRNVGVANPPPAPAATPPAAPKVSAPVGQRANPPAAVAGNPPAPATGSQPAVRRSDRPVSAKANAPTPDRPAAGEPTADSPSGRAPR